jgi:hypothetical protein
MFSLVRTIKLGVGIILCLLLLACVKEPEELSRNNIFDPGGTVWNPPHMRPTNDTIAGYTDQVTLRVQGADTNGTIKKYAWLIPGFLNDTTDTNGITVVFPDSGSYPVYVLCKDNDGIWSAPDTFLVRVHLYRPWVKLSSRNLVAGMKASATFTVTAGDTNGPVIGYQWSVDGGTARITRDPSLTVQFDSTGMHFVLVQAIDNDSLLSPPDTGRVAVKGNEPLLYGPLSQAHFAKLHDITLSWMPGHYAHHYSLRLDTTPSPSRVLFLSLTDTARTVDTLLQYAKTYYWRVVGFNDSGDSALSTTWSFTTPLKPTLSLASPDDGASLVGLSTNLSWTPPGVYKKFTILMDTIDVPSVVIKDSTSATTIAVAGLKYSKTYYWRVIATDFVGDSDTSSIRRFMTPTGARIQLLTPEAGEELTSLTQTLTWGPAGAFDTFEVYCDTLSPPLRLLKQTTDTFTVLNNQIKSNRIYYWRVTGRNKTSEIIDTSDIRTFTTPPSSAPPKDGLVAYWPFSATADDESGNSNNGTISGVTLAQDRFGNDRSAFSFNGADNFIQVPHNALFNSEALTLSLWLKSSSLHYTPLLFKGNSNSSSWQYSLMKSSDTIFAKAYQPNGSTYSIATTTISPNLWHNITATIENLGAVTIYVDGKLAAKSTSTSGTWQLNGGSDLYFGKALGSAGAYAGILDDIRIYNRILAPEEIAAIAGEGGFVAPLPAPLLTAVGLDTSTIAVSWSKVDGATSYVLESSTQQKPTAEQLYKGTDTSFTHEGHGKGQVVYYRVKAVDQQRQSEWSTPTSAITSDPIAFTTPLPFDILVGKGDTVELIAQWEGSGPFSVVWKKQDITIDSIANVVAGKDTLRLQGVDSTAMGIYTLRVKNATTAATTGPCTVTVSNFPSVPRIITNPTSLKVLVGDSVGLSVVAEGVGTLTYQWYKNNELLDGKTHSELSFPSFSEDDSGSYTCAVTNLKSTTISLPARLRIPTVSLMEHGVVYFDSINPSIEMDEWWFKGNKGETVWLRINKDAGVSLNNSHPWLAIELRNANNTLLTTVTTDWSPYGEIKDFVLPASGSYHISISEVGGDHICRYNLTLLSTSYAETNSRILVPASVNNNDTISPSVQVDSWMFDGNTGDNFSVRVNKQRGVSLNNSHPWLTLELRDSSYSVVASATSNWGPLVELKDIVLLKSGKYYVTLSEVNGDHSCWYQLFLVQNN